MRNENELSIKESDMIVSDRKIIEKAKKTEYKHPYWYSEGGKTVYEAIYYMASTGDFYLDVTRKYKSIGELKKLPLYNGENTREGAVELLIRSNKWGGVVIRYKGRERGTDTGKLKIKTFIAIQRYI